MKTLEEFAIKEIEDLRREVEKLKSQNHELNCIIDKQNEEYLENKAFIEELKKDFKCELHKSGDYAYIKFDETIWSDNNENKFDYYKQKLGLGTYDDYI